jgi:hypothetical protein
LLKAPGELSINGHVYKRTELARSAHIAKAHPLAMCLEQSSPKQRVRWIFERVVLLDQRKGVCAGKPEQVAITLQICHAEGGHAALANAKEFAWAPNG